MEEGEDAAVWQFNEEDVLIATTDFFTPIVDNPFDYGQIAAANSLSDIYAMGGKPFMALNIAGFPPQLPTEIASEILRGGATKALEAGGVIAGGHTIQDQEPKYGLVALGIAQKDQLLRKGAMQPGDALFLSKPVGSGILTTAIKKDVLLEQEVQQCIDWMKRLSAQASKIALACKARAATDITGFSLLGHGWEMVAASKAGMRIVFEDVPFFPEVEELAKQGCFPGGSFDNFLYYKSHVSFADGIDEQSQLMLFDPQTSGGLLFAIPAAEISHCQEEAVKRAIPLWRIGDATDTQKIEVVRA